MAHRLSLSKLTGKQPATQALPVMSFRYNPCDEDIQELQPMDTTKDNSTTSSGTQQSPLPQAASSGPGTSAQAVERSMVSAGSRDSSVERPHTSGHSTDKKHGATSDVDVPDHPLATTSERASTPEPAPSVPASTEGRAQTTDHAPAATELESAKVEASPVKDSVKDYLSKFSKKSSASSATTAATAEGTFAMSHSATGAVTAATTTPADGTDSWFTGLKGRITKRLEEKRHGARHLRREEDTKSASTVASDLASSGGGTHHEDETTSMRTGMSHLDECREAMEKAEEAAAATRMGSSRVTVPFTTDDDKGFDPDLTTWEFIEQPERPLKHPLHFVPPPSLRMPSQPLFQGLQGPNLAALAHAVMSKNSFLFSALVGLLALVLPMPAFSSGFIFGCVLSFFIFSFLWFLLVPTQERFPFEVPDYRRMPPLRVPRQTAWDRSDVPSYEGWMCQLPFEHEYHIETHHMNNTKSVHLVLTGSTLRLRWPKHPVPRRAMWNEKRPEPVFISQRHFSLADAKVMLLPEKLSRERLWNKKYPICLLIPSEDHNMRQAQTGLNEADTQPQMGSDEDLTADTVKDLFVRNSARNASATSTATTTTTTAASPATAPATPAKDDLTVAGNTGSPSKELSQEEPSAVLGQKNGSVSKDAHLPATASTRSVRASKSEHEVLYLFARTCREKEEWFRRFQQAIMSSSGDPKGKRARFEDPAQQPVTYEAYIEELQLRHREQLWVLPCLVTPKNSAATSTLGSPQTNTFAQGVKSDTQWLNVLVGRLFYDVFTQHEWADRVRRRMQKKLSRIKVPFFMEELTVTDIHLGSQLPYVRRTSEAVVDKRGVWVDMDVTYNGAFYMTLSTKLNLMRLKRSQNEEMQSLAVNHDGSDDESAASSSEDEGAADKGESSAISRDASSATGTGKKLLELVDKIAQSRYFQQATENRYIKRKMEEVSNMPLVLTVEVSHLVGTLALNIPPPPTDRIWYGFRTLPKMQLLARPKLGAKEVTIARVTERIEKMLFIEFQRIFVMPNMDDFMVPLMHSDITES